MKMQEFLNLNDDEKVDIMSEHEVDNNLYTFIEDKGKCSQCGGEADASDFCFGCKKLICPKCFEEEPHLTECLSKL